MSGVLDILFPGADIRLDDAEEALGRPDEEEAESLRLHVDRCAKRWIMSYRAQKSLSHQVSRLNLFVLIALALLIAQNGVAIKTFLFG